MKEIGRILKINGTKVTIKGGELAACFGCMNEECKSNGKQFTAQNSLNLPIEEGQLVEIENKTSTAMLQGITVFLPPVLLFILGYVLTGRLVPASSDDVRVGIGVASLFLGFFITYWVRKWLPARGAPYITRVIEVPNNKFAPMP
jgi:sigma-E factor negative regulatory protein RseC